MFKHIRSLYWSAIHPSFQPKSIGEKITDKKFSESLSTLARSDSVYLELALCNFRRKENFF